MEESTHSLQIWLLATEPWAGHWTVSISIVRFVTPGTSERSRRHAWIPNLYEMGKAFRNMKSRITQPLLCLDRLNAFRPISFRSFFFFFNISNQYKSSQLHWCCLLPSFPRESGGVASPTDAQGRCSWSTHSRTVGAHVKGPSHSDFQCALDASVLIMTSHFNHSFHWTNEHT